MPITRSYIERDEWPLDNETCLICTVDGSYDIAVMRHNPKPYWSGRRYGYELSEVKWWASLPKE